MNRDSAFFSSARPVWAKGLEHEMNIMVGLRAKFSIVESQNVVLKITCSSVYRFFINGDFGGHGPAVAAHGYYRVDQWDLSQSLKHGNNIIAIEAAGYNVDSFYILNQPSFVQAEIVADGKAVAATGESRNEFELGVIPERIQRTQRYSYQRPFSEVYRITDLYGSWRSDTNLCFNTADCIEVSEKKLLPRGVKYPDFSVKNPETYLSCGYFEAGIKPEHYWKDRSLVQAGSKIGGFKESELEVIPSLEIQEIKATADTELNCPYDAFTELKLQENSFHIFDFGINLTGFIGVKICAAANAKLFLAFDEVLSDGDVSYKRLDCVNILSYEVEKGEYTLESFEPYTLRFLKIMVLEGACSIRKIYLREYASSDVHKAEFECSDNSINQVFEAGRQTFRQNALDIFMDCPSRERAGWLCDSFFTARVAADLSGNTLVERNFLENYLLPEKYPHIPDGMFPMCYPSDHYNGQFIPNWALWLVIELKEYLERSGDHELIYSFKNKVMNLFQYFEAFKNEDGLLENLESWIFVEWSKANDYVQDVNYPSNMLYAAALAVAAELYDLNELLEEAEGIKKKIREQAFNGRFFVDNAVRREGKLLVQDNKSEICQYYAFYFNVAAPQTYPELWETLLKKFGPARGQNNEYPDVCLANAFIGNYLRLELLSRFGHINQMLGESLEYFIYMAERTGTLWEHTGTRASCNHGFASHVVHCFYRDILGVYRIDTKEKVIYLRFQTISTDWCRGIMPVGDDIISIEWKKEKEKLIYNFNIPEGYKINVENFSGLALLSNDERLIL